MTEIYYTKTVNVHAYLEEILKSKTDGDFVISRTAKGKPFIEGNRVFFSLSHCGTRAAIAIADMPVGIDTETVRGRKHSSVIKRFTDAERDEINCEQDFLINWTVKEAFIKMKGGTLAEYLKSLQYFGGNLYFEGKKQNCEIKLFRFENSVTALCTQEK